ncbi:MAG: glycosyltransferase [Kiritimatiellae bacterium]|nr:glycosyltransferase [Kiritimatiellia bacterium]
MNNMPILSVVIPTIGRPHVLRAVESLLAAEWASTPEIIVVGAVPDQFVAERLKDLLNRNPHVIHLPVSFARGDSSEKKNAGWKAAHAGIIAFLDDDVAVGKNWPAAVLEPFADEAVGLLSGPGLVPDDIPLVARLAGWTLASRAAGYVQERYQKGGIAPRPAKWSRLIGCNMAFRRKVLEEIGGFDANFWPGEEMLAAHIATARKGWRLVFQPQAMLYHYPRASYGGFLKQMFGYGATRIRLIRAGAEIEPATLAPMFLLVSLAILAIGAFFSKIFLAALVVCAAFYLFFAAGCAFLKWRDERDFRALLIFFMVPGMHLCYGLAGWIELFFPNRDLSVKPVARG